MDYTPKLHAKELAISDDNEMSEDGFSLSYWNRGIWKLAYDSLAYCDRATLAY